MSPPRRIVVALLGVLAVALAATPTAGAAAQKHHRKAIHPPAAVRVERVKLARTPSGRPALLVAVRYPIQAAGRRLRLVARIRMRPGTVPLADAVAHRLSAGALRRPERRRTFTFVHEIDLKASIARGLSKAWHEGRAPLVTVEAQGGIDIDADGKADIRSQGIPRRNVRLAPPAKGAATASASAAKPFCASVPVVEVAPRGQATIPLPACTRPVRWSVTAGASAGSAHLAADHLTYTAPATPGTETIRLDHATVVVKVTRPWLPLTPLSPAGAQGPVVRAMGDSVIAGFGYYSDGSSMGILSLYECKPRVRCSTTPAPRTRPLPRTASPRSPTRPTTASPTTSPGRRSGRTSTA